MAMRSYQYRLYLNARQERLLFNQLAVARHVYNMALEARKLGWELEQKRLNKSDGETLAKYYKKTFPQAKLVHSHVLQVAIADLDKGFKAFFRRVKTGDTAGYPRFKSYKRFHSIGFKQYGNGFKVDGRRLRVSGVGRIRVRWHRPIEGKIKTCRISHKAGRWYVSFACEVAEKAALPKTGRDVGLDVGISALITSSEGHKEHNPKWYREAQDRLCILNRRLARAKRGSNQRKKKRQAVQRWHEHIKNQRKEFFNKVVFDLVQAYDLIAIEDLQIKNMVKNRHLSKSILDAGWGDFKQRLHDKAVEAGRLVIEVNPAYTSKTCSNCDAIFKTLTLADRWVECDCGLSLDRDHNAAINILKRAGRVRVP